MDSSPIPEIEHAIQLYKKQKFQELYAILINYQDFDQLPLDEKIKVKYLIGKAEHYFGNYLKALDYWDWIIDSCSDGSNGDFKNIDLIRLDGEIAKIESMWRMGLHQESLQSIDSCEKLITKVFKKSNNYPENQYRLRRAQIAYSKGGINWITGNIDDAIKFITESIDIYKLIGDLTESARMLASLGLLYGEKGELNKGLSYLFDAESILENLNETFGLVKCYVNIGWIYRMQGDLDLGLVFLKKAIEIGYKNKFYDLIGTCSDEISNIYRLKGEALLALKYSEDCVTIFQETNNYYEASRSMANLIRLLLDHNDLLNARRYLGILQKMHERNPNKRVKIWLELSNSLILWQTCKFDDLIQAKTKLMELSKEEGNNAPQSIDILLNLSELSIEELKITEDVSILSELDQIINNLLELTETQHLYVLYIEMHLLISKFALIQGEINKARTFLQKAEEKAEKFKINQYSRFISFEHDIFLETQNNWDYHSPNSYNLRQRLHNANLHTIYDRILHGKVLSSALKEPEIPIMLIITDNKSNILFQKNFTNPFNQEEILLKNFQDHFVDIVNCFIAESHDRTKIGDNFLVMKRLQSFYLSYIYIGDTYSAKLKLKQFFDSFHAIPAISLIFQKSFVSKKLIQYDQNPELAEKIESIFLI